MTEGMLNRGGGWCWSALFNSSACSSTLWIYSLCSSCYNWLWYWPVSIRTPPSASAAARSASPRSSIGVISSRPPPSDCVNYVVCPTNQCLFDGAAASEGDLIYLLRVSRLSDFVLEPAADAAGKDNIVRPYHLHLCSAEVRRYLHSHFA